MVKFVAIRSKDKRVLAGFCLTEENIRLLKEDKPILIKSEDMNNALGFDVTIMYGRNDKEITKKLIDMGVINDNTELHGTPEYEEVV